MSDSTLAIARLERRIRGCDIATKSVALLLYVVAFLSIAIGLTGLWAVFLDGHQRIAASLIFAGLSAGSALVLSLLHLLQRDAERRRAAILNAVEPGAVESAPGAVESAPGAGNEDP